MASSTDSVVVPKSIVEEPSAWNVAVRIMTDFGGLLVAFCVIIGVFIAVLAILRQRGARVQLTASVFIAALVVTQLLMKELSSTPFSYKFPACVSALHFLSIWMVCCAYWTLKRDWRKCHWRSVGTAQRYLETVLPIALSLPLSIILSNRAMLYVGAGVNAVVATLAPVTTAALSHLLGRHISMISWAGVGVACSGALLITSGEVGALWPSSQSETRQEEQESGSAAESMGALFGLGLSFGAVFARSIKAVLQDKLLKPRAYSSSPETTKAASLEPLQVWALQGPPCFLVAASIAVATEDVQMAYAQLTPEVSGMIFATCFSATILNITGMFSVRDLGASSMQIVGKLNTLVTMALSVALLGETLPSIAIAGTVVVLAGVAIFEYGEARYQGSQEKLPT